MNKMIKLRENVCVCFSDEDDNKYSIDIQDNVIYFNKIDEIIVDDKKLTIYFSLDNEKSSVKFICVNEYDVWCIKEEINEQLAFRNMKT